MTFSEKVIRSARRHLRHSDRVMRVVIDDVGPFTLRSERDRFWMLVRSIISQQISLGAARSIRSRLQDLVSPASVTPDSLLRFDTGQLRTAGISPQKAQYLLDLAQKASDGTVNLRSISRLSDEDVIAELTQVKGIGRWTAQMFLIFALSRPDVLAHDDLGLRTAIRDRYGLDDLPDLETTEDIARPWRPYASVACWYCWRSLDLARNGWNGSEGYPT